MARAKAARASWAGLVGVAAAGSERSGNAAARAGRHLGVGNCRRCRTPLENGVPGFLGEALMIGARKQGASGGWWVDPVLRAAGRRVGSRLGGGCCCCHLHAQFMIGAIMKWAARARRAGRFLRRRRALTPLEGFFRPFAFCPSLACGGACIRRQLPQQRALQSRLLARKARPLGLP